MKQTRIGRQLSYEIRKAKISHGEAAQLCSTTAATISHLLYAADMRPKADTLKKVCHAFDHQANIRLLITHLQDEIERAGYNGDATLQIRELKKHDDSRKAEILAMLSERAMENENLYAILLNLYNVITPNQSYPSLPGNAPDIAAIE